MNIIIAPDSFKGSLTSTEAAEAIALGVIKVIPGSQIDQIPIADGGEGTMDSLMYSTGGQYIDVTVLDPLGRNINTQYGILGNKKTAVIEMSRASGMTLLSKNELNPLFTSTYGTGQLIHKALNNGYKDFIICIGGSATNDCGTGMAQALGIKFLTSSHQEITGEMCGDLLDDVSYIDASNINPEIKKSKIIVASDVDNPLLGDQGCAKVYAPQKGASSMIVDQLEKNMTSFIDLAESEYKTSIRDIQGAGAAGGLGAGLMMFLDAQIKPGVDIVLNACDFKNRIKNADLIITGEGKIDRQTVHGKTISGVTRFAHEFKIPVIAFAGIISDFKSPQDLNLLDYHSISTNDISIEDSIKNASTLLEKKVEQVVGKYYNKT